MKQRLPTRTHLQPRALAALSAIAIIVAAALPLAAPAQAQDQAIPQNVAPDVADILKSGQYQTEIPGGKAADGGTQIAPDTSSSNASPEAHDTPMLSFDATAAHAIIQLVIYALIAGLAILVLAAIFQAYRRSSSREAAPEVVEALTSPVAPQAPRPALLDRIEELAAAGDFEAAIHLMLLRALATLRTRLGELPDSLTSREILRRSNLPQDAGRPLSVIIGAVEVSHFGGQSPNEAVYRLCIDHYRQFLGSAA